MSSDVDDVGDDVVDGGGGVMTMGDEMVENGGRLGMSEPDRGVCW